VCVWAPTGSFMPNFGNHPLKPMERKWFGIYYEI